MRPQESSIMACAQHSGVVALQGIREPLEGIAVEAAHAVVGTEPHIALPVLFDGKDFVAGQAVVGGVLAEYGREMQGRLRCGEGGAKAEGYEQEEGGAWGKSTVFWLLMK
jgi:hypothetical protein